MAGIGVRRVAVVCGLVLAGMSLSEVMAADLEAPPPEPVPVVEPLRWEGPYVGAHIGYDGFRTSNSVIVGPAQSWNQDADGWLGGILLGYNAEFESFVLGVEADAGFGKASQTETRSGLGKVRITDHGQHTFRARAGLPTSIGLFYVTGGLGLSDVWIRSDSGKDENFHWGYVVGGGFESKVTESVSLRAEYLYSNFGDETYNLGDNRLKSEFDSHRFRVGVSWYFW